jgi:hypothetical protein
MNSEWNENASRMRSCSKCRETERYSGSAAPSLIIFGVKARSSRVFRNGRRPGARMPSS